MSGYAQVPNHVLRSNLSPQAKALYAILCSYAWGSSNECFTSQQRLSDDLGASLRSVQGWVKELREAGAIEVGKRGKLNRYVILSKASHPQPVAAEHPQPVAAQKKTHEKKTQDQDHATASPPRSPRNIIWDSLVEVYHSPSTRSEASNFGKTVSEIREALQADGIPEERWRDEVLRRARALGDDPKFNTHTSLRNRWSTLVDDNPPEPGYADPPSPYPKRTKGTNPCYWCEGSGVDPEKDTECVICSGTGVEPL